MMSLSLSEQGPVQRRGRAALPNTLLQGIYSPTPVIPERGLRGGSFYRMELFTALLMEMTEGGSYFPLMLLFGVRNDSVA